MQNYQWPLEFRNLFDKGVERYRGGNHQAATFFDDDEKRFLDSIGATAQEFFDFVEDFARGGEPGFETVLLITAVRREYFIQEQKGVRSSQTINMETLPPKNAELNGIRWLPRIIAKAQAKLRGEMPAELMFGCGGDRPFLFSVNIEPSDFLRVVWHAGDDTQQIVDYVLKSRGER